MNCVIIYWQPGKSCSFSGSDERNGAKLNWRKFYTYRNVKEWQELHYSLAPYISLYIYMYSNMKYQRIFSPWFTHLVCQMDVHVKNHGIFIESEISSHANKYKIFKACSLYAKTATWISSVDYFDSYDDNEKDATNLWNTKAYNDRYREREREKQRVAIMCEPNQLHIKSNR